MTILVYLGHPAHFHLFKESIKTLESHSHKIIIVIKSKDVLEKLLIDSGLPYINVTANDPKKTGARGFLQRMKALRKIIKASSPSLLVGSAAELAVLGRYFNIPSYIFFEDDFEAVKKFARIAGPLATKLICPECCSAWKWNYKKTGYKSYHELAYLHPNHFTPDPDKVKGIFNPDEKNFILRFAKLTAYHDKGKSGITSTIAQQLIDILSPHGNVFITSERELEPEFEKYRIQISPLNIHHALYFADMYIGDSQTMTAESAVLGTPAIRFNDFVGELSYLEELEHTFNLTFGFRTSNPEQMLEKVKQLIETTNLKDEWARRRESMLSERTDFSLLMTSLIEGKPV